MNEIDIKLCSGNPIFITQAVSRIIHLICDKKDNQNLKTSKEFSLLLEKCYDSNPSICLPAAKGVISLVKSGMVESAVIITEFLTTLQRGSYSELFGPVYVIYNLWIRNKEEMQLKDDKNPSDVFSTNPLVQIVALDTTNKACLSLILSYIQEFYLKEEERLKSRGREIFMPLYMYIFHNDKIPIIYKHQLWNFLIRNSNINDSVLMDVFRWTKICTKDDFEEIEYYLQSLLEHMRTEKLHLQMQVLALHQVLILYEKLTCRTHLGNTIDCLIKIIHEESMLNVANSMLLILSNCVAISPVVNLGRIFELILLIAENNNCINAITFEAIKACILPWILYPHILDDSTLKLAKEILLFDQDVRTTCYTSSLYSEQFYQNVKNIFPHSDLMLSLSVVYEIWDDTPQIIEWLDSVEQIPDLLFQKISSVINGLLIAEFDETEINIKALKILLKFSQTKPPANNLLVLILYKLSKTKDPSLHFELLNAIPKMAAYKENLQLIVLTLESLTNGVHELRTLAMKLFYDLWLENNKCYSFLEKVLVSKAPTGFSDYYVVKANILEQLSKERPELYGKDLVPHLSMILNKCQGLDEEEIASAMAIKGIKHLCKSEIIDIKTTWAILDPKLAEDQRISVIQSYCGLLSEVPNLLEEFEKSNDDFIKGVVSRLWSFVLTKNESPVIQAALNALSCFSLEQISAQLPEEFKDEQLGEIIMDLVPGRCWIRFLQKAKTSHLSLRGDFLVLLIKREISGYHRGIYETTHRQCEPSNYNYLPPHSVTAAVGNYLKINIQKSSDPVYLECLRILSHEYSKPLPPFNWAFLQEFIYEPEARQYCISIASHQVMLSGTARRLMENYITALSETYTSDEDAINVYKNFKDLCNSIQPMIMRPFIEKSLDRFNTACPDDESFRTIVEYLKITLENDKVQATNKSVIAEVISGKCLELYSSNAEAFQKYLDCIVAFPVKYLEKLSSPKKYSHISIDQLKMCFKIRCHVAFTSDGNLWEVNDILLSPEYVCVLDNSYIFKEITPIIQKHKLCTNWIIHLLGTIQNMLTESHVDDTYVTFLFDLLMYVIIHGTGHEIFLNDETSVKNIFPCSVVRLVKHKEWNNHTTYLIEWLYNMIGVKQVCEEYRNIFKECLVGLRNETDFRKNCGWLKYMTVQFML